MTPRARGILLHVVVSLAIIALVLTAALMWTVYTEPGARWGFERLGAYFPGELHADQVRGPLRGPLIVYGLHYKTDRADVRVDRLFLDWRLRALAVHRLDVRRLDAQGVRVALYVSRTPKSPAD